MGNFLKICLQRIISISQTKINVRKVRGFCTRRCYKKNLSISKYSSSLVWKPCLKSMWHEGKSIVSTDHETDECRGCGRLDGSHRMEGNITRSVWETWWERRFVRKKAVSSFQTRVRVVDGFMMVG